MALAVLLGVFGLELLLYGGLHVIESRRNVDVQKLGETKNLTFKYDEHVDNQGPSQGLYFKQLICYPEGSAGCDFTAKISQVTCYNRGIIDGKVKWRCSAPGVVTFPYRFGRTDVWCGRLQYTIANHPNSYVRNERSCGLLYTVDYIVNPFVFIGAVGLVVGVLLTYWIYKKYLKSTNQLLEVTSQVKNPKDIVFNEDPFNAWVWGTSGDSGKVRGSHSIGVTPAAAAPAHAPEQDGGSGDWVPPAGKVVTEAEAEDDDGEGAFQSSLSSRTSFGGTATVTRFQLTAAGVGRAQEDGGFGDGVPPTPWKANKVVIDEEDDNGRALHRTGSSLIRLSSRTSSSTIASSSARPSVVVSSHNRRNFARGSASRH